MSSLFHWWSSLLSSLVSMGCVLLRPAVTVEGVRYKVLRQLAEGGFSTVQLARDIESGHKVALKRITCHSIEDQNLAKAEIQTMKKLAHENIIKLVGWTMVGEADLIHNRTSEVILVMPYYPRGTLHEELESRAAGSGQPFREAVLLRLFLGVCAAVRELHRSEPVLAHRDIKPHNVLLEEVVVKGRKEDGGGDLRPILMDLGSVASARVTVRNHRSVEWGGGGKTESGPTS
jgi:serine/threonine kinase 16